MSTADVNGISINYRLEGEGTETVVLVNGLADDLESWGYQTPALLDAGFRVLTFDNRGVGESDKPAGPYSTKLFAQDTKALVDSLGLSDFHLLGVSMGGMIVQEYALAYPGDIRSLIPACTYAAPGPFCSRMFALWEEMAPVMGLKSVMQDVTLWAFTQEFFETRPEELAEFEEAMATLQMPIDAYLAQLSSIQTHDATARLGEITRADDGDRGRGRHPDPRRALAPSARGHRRLGVRDGAGRPRLHLGAPGPVQRRRDRPRPRARPLRR